MRGVSAVGAALAAASLAGLWPYRASGLQAARPPPSRARTVFLYRLGGDRCWPTRLLPAYTVEKDLHQGCSIPGALPRPVHILPAGFCMSTGWEIHGYRNFILN